MGELTEDDTFAAIGNALTAQDMPAVVSFLSYAAPRWPERTARVLEAIRVGTAIREETR